MNDNANLAPELVLAPSKLHRPEEGVYEVLSITVAVPECPHGYLWPRELDKVRQAGYRMRIVDQ